jgi:hypothetical protein
MYRIRQSLRSKDMTKKEVIFDYQMSREKQDLVIAACLTHIALYSPA